MNEKILLALRTFNESLKDKGLLPETKVEAVQVTGIASTYPQFAMPTDEQLAKTARRLQAERQGE